MVKGGSVVIAMGFAQAAVEKAAKEFPNTKFAIIDMVVDLPTLICCFREHECLYWYGGCHGFKIVKLVLIRMDIL